jgi:hypothetical protein
MMMHCCHVCEHLADAGPHPNPLPIEINGERGRNVRATPPLSSQALPSQYAALLRSTVYGLFNDKKARSCDRAFVFPKVGRLRRSRARSGCS